MQKEFMLYIRNAGDAKAALTADKHSDFIRKCEVYIERLKASGKLIAAQPIVREGFIVAKSDGGWTTVPVDPSGEVQVGYYHILANDMDEAIALAKENPEFEFVPSATVEVKPIKTKEAETGFVYPAIPNGKICYLEIPATNIAESVSFYKKVFGWNIRTRGDGSIAFDDVPNGVSGTWILNRKPHTESGLLVYIMVNDVAATLETILANGGKVVEPMTGNAPEFIAKFSDPAGNILGIGQE